MTYELAKQLKDAGFPQRGEWGYRFYPDGTMTALSYHRSVPQESDTYAPTLSELIGACQPHFDSLICIPGIRRGSEILQKGEWEATANLDNITTTGTLPEEAVAKLWLAL